MKIKIHARQQSRTDVHIYQWNDWAAYDSNRPGSSVMSMLRDRRKRGRCTGGSRSGDLVSGEGHITCGKCRNCLEGHKENW